MNTFDTLSALRTIGLTPRVVQACLALAPQADEQLLRVVAVSRHQLLLHDGVQQRAAWAWPSLMASLMAARDQLVVGDWVLALPPAAGDVAVAGAGAGVGASIEQPAWQVTRRLPPLNAMTRRVPAGHRQRLVSHVDVALLVLAADRPMSLRWADRWLALARLAHASPVVVLTKADLLARSPMAHSPVAALERHWSVGAPGAVTPGSTDGDCPVPIRLLDGRGPEVLEQLSPWLKPGLTLALVGPSGAGKSTLANTLTALGGDPAQLPVGEVRASDGEGRHTSTGRALFRCAGGTCLIDTPGLRSLQLDAAAADLEQAFDDVQTLASACQFRNCRHGSEPGCAVRASLAPSRLGSWHKLHREAQRQEMDWLGRRALLAEWKLRSKSARRRQRAEASAA